MGHTNPVITSEVYCCKQKDAAIESIKAAYGGLRSALKMDVPQLSSKHCGLATEKGFEPFDRIETI